ncbi:MULTISPECIES: type II secretion system protein [unclassified Sporosarcina]|uniref:type II secretion system protein n=1 Tax=unclassified Sporosarcina TaxID=2647733 RepID=UPI00117AADE5|nr:MULTISPECIES: type II secretion system protein [unclassified Sporosarcina]
MNEKGQSWPEAMLSLLVVMVIFGSLVPLADILTSSATEKKQAMIAAQTTYQAAILYKSSGQTTGHKTHEDLHYNWMVSDRQICVAYEIQQIEKHKCVSL